MIAERIAAVRQRIEQAAARAGRDPAGVTLVAVSKNHPPDAVRAALDAGVVDFGENRMQEAEAKLATLADCRPRLHWHFVGHLQSNKVRKVLAFADLIHSVDEVELAQRLDRAAGDLARTARILVQVDLAGEETKSGLPAASLLDALDQMRQLSHLCVEGLMLLPPYEEDAERVRQFFRRLRELRDEARRAGLLAGGELSMGMSHDLEVAVEEGATLVRVGTAIFGERARQIAAAP
jgi:pyridoxal phosphate enzyme (YggS family)